MYILNAEKTFFIDAEAYSRFMLSHHQDAELIIASRERGDTPETLGRYADRDEATEVLLSLFDAIRNGDDCFEMPLSYKWGAVERIHDARVKRKGGS